MISSESFQRDQIQTYPSDTRVSGTGAASYLSLRGESGSQHSPKQSTTLTRSGLCIQYTENADKAHPVLMLSLCVFLT